MAKVAAAVPGAAAAAASVSSMPLSASLSSAPSVSAITAAAAAASLPYNSPAGRELRQLQNRLEKATVKANEAFSIRKTYEQVIEKLRQEEPLLESRIRALEEQKTTKVAALQTATLSSREVQAAKEVAKTTLTALEEEVTANRARRARVLAEMREKESSRGELEDITARDLIVRLCRTAGAKRVSELVARLLAQQESYANLVEMRSQATAQRLALVQELEVLRKHRDDLQGSGRMTTQNQMDAAQEELQDALSRADAAGEALECLLRSHADVRSGLEHLVALVSPLPLPPGGQPAVPLEEETMGDVLAQIEQRLVGAYKVIAALPKAVDMLESMYASLRQ
ncbi:hypothetical protein VOLCADRAFT_105118 [Volvox carteri f. nagariensis]|uniref:Uncharacterized protein n=1 Tax=Volvox carteri f. nagariensis TaxID=3068 RepID=D8TYY5_VOLCA|nr:uncharacterized protein VOLCADRAFT_105118 [Volvox carteri f. nagariensis]EFJ47394.1 hypothetical protein VOLCADRAFT_105118 [Volvox carteri f. nagariensis]|eukprot:XP_002951583.1 hypothetical protein VOLCADRAFT_105118 [Volvox carteri f. nagariensis]